MFEFVRVLTKTFSFKHVLPIYSFSSFSKHDLQTINNPQKKNDKHFSHPCFLVQLFNCSTGDDIPSLTSLTLSLTLSLSLYSLSFTLSGGLEKQIQEIKEAVELPLTHPELYEDIGIRPPKGVILYGQPGTGKTLLAKAVANQTSATFLRIVGSELIQKYLGDGPKLVREVFQTADEMAPR